MAGFTSKAAGNWSSGGQTTWNETGVPTSGDTVVITHAITIDADTTIDGITFSAALTLASAKTLSLRGTVSQADATFTMASGSILQATANTVKWLQGTANNQTLCKIVVNGVIGSHCQIKLNGGTRFYFDGGEEGSGAFGNCGGWDCTYCDFTGIDKDGTYAMAIGSNDFGLHNRRFTHCTFSNCGALFLAHPYVWGGSADKDFYFRNCKFDGVPRQTQLFYFRVNSTGAGVIEFKDNSCSDYVDFSMVAGLTHTITGNYFGNGGSFVCLLGTGNFMRNISRTHEPLLPALTNMYIFHDHIDPADPILGLNDVGNPHMWDAWVQNSVNTDVILEYPHEFNIDGGDGLYSTSAAPDGSVLTRCLSLPSMTDDGYSAALLALGTPTVNAVVQHCTVLGRGATITGTERNHSGTTCISQFESNLTVGFGFGNARGISGAFDWATPAIDILLPHAGYDEIDVVPASACKNNDIYYPSPANFGVPPDSTGLVREGWAIRMTNPVDATNRNYSTGSPQFLDQTRCCATYAVAFLGATVLPTRPAFPVNHANASWITWLTAKRAALDIFHNALMADPSLGAAVHTWVLAGFRPTDPNLDPATPVNRGTDGLTRGAVEFSGSGLPPPSTSKFFKALGR